MATLMPMCAGLVGPKSENVENVSVLNAFLKGSKGARAFQECKQLAENIVLGGKSAKKTSKHKKNEPLDMRWQA